MTKKRLLIAIRTGAMDTCIPEEEGIAASSGP